MSREKHIDTNEETGIDVFESLETPKMYKVILHNDDYTTMEFVIEILERIFNKNTQEATTIMLDVHKRGAGICGIYTYDIAVTKVAQVHELAVQNQFPLRCSYEEE
jgi:ATP-dependent Clp protease adaptor protein ClpS